jgi:glyoxylase-like metal-dependent hydrolase (beta-lactamase superfamily II)
MLVEAEYSGYKDFQGVRFPARIVQKADGFPALDIAVTAVAANRPVDITVPTAVRNAPAMQPTVNAQRLADGVFWLTGGSHHSLVIEMRDHIVLVDTPNGEARALAVIAKAKALMPGKPIRHVIVMHHHWDHIGGIRTAIDEGATIATYESNRALLKTGRDGTSHDQSRSVAEITETPQAANRRPGRRAHRRRADDQALHDDRIRSHG